MRILLVLTSCLLLASCDAPYLVKYLDDVRTKGAFDSLSRSIDNSTVSPLPHVMFLIDRRNANRIYYINCKVYDWHLTFAHAQYLSFESFNDFVEHNYHAADRRFILGNIVWQPTVGKYTWELYEDDTPTPEIITLTDSIVNASFFAHVTFTPISIFQEELASKVSALRYIPHSSIWREGAYAALHTGESVGKIHIVRDSNEDMRSNEIVVLHEMPLELAPVSGVIAAEPSTALSHVNLLARAWNIPNIYLNDAEKRIRAFDGKWVRLQAILDTFTIRDATPEEIAHAVHELESHRHIAPASDLSERRLLSLSEQRANMRKAFGAKSANLGEIVDASVADIHVPPGFAIPFVYYKEYLRANGFDTIIQRFLEDSLLYHDRKYRRGRLAELRNTIEHGTIDSMLARNVLSKAHAMFSGNGVFVRSSTNNEDLANFSGAGLYSTAPNVRGDSALLAAIRYVWASVWNDAAVEAREVAGIEHEKVYMGVLIQQAIPSECSGVMVTANPFDRDDRGAVYISAKRGLGIKVVNGGRIAEQVLYRPGYNAIRVMTHSEEDEMLVFDSSGGVKPIPTPPATRVLTEDLTLKLANAAKELKKIFDYYDQDIEWAFSHGVLYIIQSRPYIDPK